MSPVETLLMNCIECGGEFSASMRDFDLCREIRCAMCDSTDVEPF